MPMSHRCPNNPQYRYSCHYFEHDDGTDNDPALFYSWMGGPNFTTQTRWLCSGTTVVGRNVVAEGLYGLQIRGHGQNNSVLAVRGDTNGNGLAQPGLWLKDMLNSEVHEVLFTTLGVTSYGVLIGGNVTSDRTRFWGVGFAGYNTTLAAMSSYRSGNGEYYGCVWTNASPHADSSSIELFEAGGQLFCGGEIHTHVSNSDLIRINNCGGHAFSHMLFSSEPPNGPTGRSYIGAVGTCPLVSIYHGRMQSDQTGRGPDYAIYRHGSVLNNWHLDSTTNISFRQSLLGGSGYETDFRVLSHAMSDNNLYQREEIRTLRGRAYMGRNELDWPTVGCTFGGHPYPNSMRINFVHPFSQPPTVTATVEAAMNSGAGVPATATVGEISHTGFTVQTWPGDQEVNFTVVGPNM